MSNVAAAFKQVGGALTRLVVLRKHDRSVPCDGSACNNIKWTKSFLYIHQAYSVDRDPEQNTDTARHVMQVATTPPTKFLR